MAKFQCTNDCFFKGALYNKGQTSSFADDFKHHCFTQMVVLDDNEHVSSENLTNKVDFEKMREGLKAYRKKIDTQLKDAVKTIAEQKTVINALDEKIKEFDGKVAISEDDLKKLIQDIITKQTPAPKKK